MSHVLKNWLKARLDRLVNVQNTALNQEAADLVIHLWSGVKVRSYIVSEPIKTRQLRRQLQDSTSVGIGSLFLVSSLLIPKDGTRLVPDEWLMALHSLVNDRVYAFRFAANGPELFPVHFEPVPGLSQWSTCYGPALKLQRLRFFKHQAKQRAVKGDWLVADFDDPAFWKNTDYRTARDRQQQEQRRSAGRKTTWETWSGFQSWAGNDNGSQNGPMKTYLDMCYEHLGLKSGAAFGDVKSAFRRLALEFHPDVSVLPKDEAEARFRILSESYEYIKAANNWP